MNTEAAESKKNSSAEENNSAEKKDGKSISYHPVKHAVIRELKPQDLLKASNLKNASEKEDPKNSSEKEHAKKALEKGNHKEPSETESQKDSGKKEDSGAQEHHHYKPLVVEDMDAEQPEDEESEEEMDEESLRKEKKGRRIRFTILGIEIVFLILALGVLFLVTQIEKIHMINIQEQELQQNMTDEVTLATEEGVMKGYTNIALFGVDTRQNELAKDTRSDTIIIASINNNTGEIKLVSVYRDTYLNIGNDTYNKCNSAYAVGGPEQAINMLNTNLDMNITDFITVGFSGLTDAIDDLGGIELDITEEEVGHLNDYQKIMAKQQDREYIPISEAGLQHVNGLQATAYCRIRYTKGDDFRRAERQRTVLNKVFEKAKTANLSMLSAVADDVFDEVYTSMQLTEIVSYLSKITSFSIVGQDGFPQSDMRSTGTVGRKGSCVIPQTLASNVEWLHEYLFDDTDYVVSATVQEYSDRVASDTGSRVYSGSSGTGDGADSTNADGTSDISGYGYTYDEYGNVILVPLPTEDGTEEGLGTEDGTALDATGGADTAVGSTEITGDGTTDGTTDASSGFTIDPVTGAVLDAAGNVVIPGTTTDGTTEGTVTDGTATDGTVVTDPAAATETVIDPAAGLPVQ